MSRAPLVVVGASAGGIEALLALLPGLPLGFPAAVVVALHRPAATDDRLVHVLARGCLLPIGMAADGEAIGSGRIYVAPAGMQLTVVETAFRLESLASERRPRPSIDALFVSAALAYGPAVIGVLLSGMLADGSAGLAAIKAHGGRTIVQHPSDALFGDLPRHVLRIMTVDAVLPIAAIAAAITRFSRDATGFGGAAERQK